MNFIKMGSSAPLNLLDWTCWKTYGKCFAIKLVYVKFKLVSQDAVGFHEQKLLGLLLVVLEIVIKVGEFFLILVNES